MKPSDGPIAKRYFAEIRPGDDPARNVQLQSAFNDTGFQLASVAMPMHATVRAVRFPDVSVAHVTTRPVKISWSRDRPTAHNRCVFLLANKGAIKISSSGSKGIVEGGQGAKPVGMLLPGCDDVSFDLIGEPAEVILIGFSADEPTIALLKRLDDPLSLDASPIHAAVYSYMYSLTRSMTEMLDHLGDDNLLWKLTQESAKSLVTTVTSAHEASRRVQLSLFEHAQLLIDDHHHDADLDVRALARMLGISERALQVHFRRQGTTVSNAIRERRAQSARDVITTHPKMPLDVVAQLTGFRTRESLRRGLSRHVGSTPARLRAADLTSSEHDE